MSYCRWSGNDFQCDVYVYEAEDGFTIHVAGMRIRWTAPLPPPLPTYDPDTWDFHAWYERHRIVSDMLDDDTTHVREPIGLPHDGESFYGIETPGECADKLVELREVGYMVPDYAINALREEEADEGG